MTLSVPLKDTPELSIDHWGRIHGHPICPAIFKLHASDFCVTERLSFSPSGEGEHLFVWLEKTNLNTAFVAEYLAKFCQVALRDVTYAGRKDKFSLSQQWFGIHLANRAEPDWSAFELEGARIINITRNDKKLRTGALIGNTFTIKLREIDKQFHEDINQRLTCIQQFGVPNYYGEQRFGVLRADSELKLGGNLALAQKMLQGETIRNRNKRSMAISALRSWLFNEFIHQRIVALGFNKFTCGDVLQLSGSNSFFLAEENDDMIKHRLETRDVMITCPMWGKGFLHSSADVAKFEHSIAQKYQPICDLLGELGLKQERRAMLLFPENLKWQFSEDTLELAFTLPSGCFASSVLNELIQSVQPT